MTDVININGEELDMEAAMGLMNDELREKLHNAREWESEQEFFTAYEYTHLVEFGEYWYLSGTNLVW